MLRIGLIKEGKIPHDNRVALTPGQCNWLINDKNISITIQPSANRCFSDAEYLRAGIRVSEDLTHCDILFGIKEVPIEMLQANKTYFFFSHTRKQQPHNRSMLHAMMDKKISLIDYECLEHADGQRLIGFGFFAGIVGAHNGIMAYGHRTKYFQLPPVYLQKDYRELIHRYFGIKLPAIKVAVTGSGRVAHGILEIMNLLDIQEVEADEYLSKNFSYPVYVHLKGPDLYIHKDKKTYNREDFHQHPQEYECIFEPFCFHTDILLNGVYWDKNIPRLFEMETLQHKDFKIVTIADITDDAGGSVPCNLGDTTIENPVYGVDKITGKKTAPYLASSIDIMAVGNLPNELPRDASRYFGEQLIKYIFPALVNGSNEIINNATILHEGKLTPRFEYLKDYAQH